MATPAQAATNDGSTTPTDPTTLTAAQVKQIRAQQTPKPAWKIALKFAMKQRGIPYVWGGASKSGYDCSGLMLRAYEHAGIELPRVAADQYNAFGRKIAWNDLKPGDLVFFEGLGHVGMISRPGYMVHAPHTGDVVKEERLSSWRRDSFVGAVRPDPKGVRLWAKLKEQRNAPAPAMLKATL
ncbi:C40 family peptidase [Nonomuraea sp. CA-141351]|uniref:C40 family peptidase n=1 Tax=Nonomuraea sp. CA-141351 TaxID=3239996 RepID=UPI003D944A7D